MRMFAAKFDCQGKLLVPKPVLEDMKNKRLVMLFDNGEFRVVPKARTKGMDLFS